MRRHAIALSISYLFFSLPGIRSTNGNLNPPPPEITGIEPAGAKLKPLKRLTI